MDELAIFFRIQMSVYLQVDELATEMYIIKKGIVFHNNVVLRAGKTIGEDMLYYSLNR